MDKLLSTFVGTFENKRALTIVLDSENATALGASEDDIIAIIRMLVVMLNSKSPEKYESLFSDIDNCGKYLLLLQKNEPGSGFVLSDVIKEHVRQFTEIKNGLEGVVTNLSKVFNTLNIGSFFKM